MSKKAGKKKKITSTGIANILYETKELLKEWTPPFLCNSAIRFILNELDTDSVLNLCLLAIQQGICPQILSGFRLDKLTIDDSVKDSLINRLIPVLYDSEFLRTSLFIISYPNARWYKWAEVLEKADERWILENWRHIFRLTQDISIIISMAIDHRVRISKRGRRILTNDVLIDAYSRDTKSTKDIENKDDQAKLLKQKFEQKKKKLKNTIKEKDKQIELLTNEISELKNRLKKLEVTFEQRVQQRLSQIFEAIYHDKEVVRHLWEDILINRTGDIKQRVKKALKLQARIDIGYGTKHTLKRKQQELRQYLKELEFVCSESIYVPKELIDIKGLIEKELHEISSVLKASSNRDDFDLSKLKDIHLSETKTAEITKEDKKHRTDVYEIADIYSFVCFNKQVCKNTICIVDGYNVIKSAWRWAKIERIDFKSARKHFCNLWKNRANDWYKVELVFDGKGQGFDIETYKNLTVIFTDSRYSSQGADIYIVDFLKDFSKKHPDINRLLISADAVLRARCKSFCNYFADPRWAIMTYLSPV